MDSNRQRTVKNKIAHCAALCLVLCPLFVGAAPYANPDEESDYIQMENATVQIMNKAAGKVQTLTIPVNQQVKFDKMEITVQKCLGANEFLPEDFYMFVQVKKSGKEIFSGWQTKSEPGQNPLQDQDNDLWLVRCE